MTGPAYRTALPAAVAGPPARQRCHTLRGLALRTVPLRAKLDDRDLRRAYAESGPYGLALYVRWSLYDVVRNRARTVEERAVLVDWYQSMVAEVSADALARAEAEGWPCGSLLTPAAPEGRP